MADERQAPEAFEFDGEEIELEVDQAQADFNGAWFVLQIDSTVVTQQVHEKYGKSLSARLGFRIVDNEDFADTYVSTFLPLTDKRPQAAKKRKAFLNALADEDTGKKATLVIAKEFTTEGSEVAVLKGMKGERVGAYVVLKKSAAGTFMNIDDEKFMPANQVPTPTDDEGPF